MLGFRLTKRIGSKILVAVLRQEVAFHDLNENKPSLLTSQVSSSPALCRGLTSDKWSVFLQGLDGIAASLVIGFSINWKLTLVLLCPFSVQSRLFYKQV